MKIFLLALIAFEIFAALLPSQQPFWTLTVLNGFCIVAACWSSFLLGKRSV